MADNTTADHKSGYRAWKADEETAVKAKCVKCGKVFRGDRMWHVLTIAKLLGYPEAGPYCEACKTAILREWNDGVRDQARLRAEQLGFDDMGLDALAEWLRLCDQTDIWEVGEKRLVLWDHGRGWCFPALEEDEEVDKCEFMGAMEVVEEEELAPELHVCDIYEGWHTPTAKCAIRLKDGTVGVYDLNKRKFVPVPAKPPEVIG